MHGDALAAALGYTPVHLRYNSGLHVSENGDALATRLEALLARWPVPVTQLAVVGHSMGGLVGRAYLRRCVQRRQDPLLAALITVGTPHCGTHIARIGLGENARRHAEGFDWSAVAVRMEEVFEAVARRAP